MADYEDLLPFRQFVLRIHSRCDLACDHCYVYEHADQSWRGRPTVISPETVARAAERIAEHARAHRLSEVCVILHGGEPLLARGGILDADSFGHASSDVAVIETGGTIEQSESIKVAYIPQMRSCLPESPRQGTGMGGGNERR